jgi:hypothetical protein
MLKQFDEKPSIKNLVALSLYQKICRQADVIRRQKNLSRPNLVSRIIPDLIQFENVLLVVSSVKPVQSVVHLGLERDESVYNQQNVNKF